VRAVAAKHPNAVIVSGGESSRRPRQGVDWVAEEAGLRAGLVVDSFRPERASEDAGLAPARPLLRRDLDEEEEARQALISERLRREVVEFEERRAAAAETFLIARYESGLDLPDGFGYEYRDVLPGRYSSFGQAAYARNAMIVDADIVVAFRVGVSPGTGHSIDLAEKRGFRRGDSLHVYELPAA
jgi:hypothetical protein